MRARLLVIALLAGAVSGCAGDGYRFGTAHRHDVRTIAAPIFDNVTFSHGMEAMLTEAVIKELHRSTPWGVAPEATADTTLRGVITEVRLHKLNTNPTSGLVSELAVDVSVDFEWRDNRTGQTLVARRNFRGMGRFAPGSGAGEPIEVGEQAAVDRVARAIVAELRSDW